VRQIHTVKFNLTVPENRGKRHFLYFLLLYGDDVRRIRTRCRNSITRMNSPDSFWTAPAEQQRRRRFRNGAARSIGSDPLGRHHTLAIGLALRLPPQSKIDRGRFGLRRQSEAATALSKRNGAFDCQTLQPALAKHSSRTNGHHSNLFILNRRRYTPRHSTNSSASTRNPCRSKKGRAARLACVKTLGTPAWRNASSM
jgi:hypothetical protein